MLSGINLDFRVSLYQDRERSGSKMPVDECFRSAFALGMLISFIIFAVAHVIWDVVRGKRIGRTN